MSKKKGKKDELALSPPEDDFRSYLNKGCVIEDLSERLKELTEVNNKKRKEFAELTQTLDTERDTLKSLTQYLQNELDKLERGCEDKNAEKMRIKDDIQRIQKEYQEKLDELRAEKEEIIIKGNQAINTKESNLDQKEGIFAEKKKLEQQIIDLENSLADQTKRRITEVSDKEREKISATANLKDNMKEKIDETKANLKALNDEQLQTTTRLTILQNHQLTTELEYQSKQTEKLLNKNNKMQDQISSLKRDIELHKEIESELAKKFHRSQKKIKKLNEEVKVFDDQLSDMKTKDENEKKDKIDNAKNSEDLVNVMEHKLEEIESQLTSTTSNFEGLQIEYNNLQDKLSESKDKYKRAALICTDFLEDMLNSNPNILNDQSINFNLELLKTTPLEKLPKEEKSKLVEDLLRQIQPYLSTNNLSVDPPESMKMYGMKGKHSKGSFF